MGSYHLAGDQNLKVNRTKDANQTGRTLLFGGDCVPRFIHLKGGITALSAPLHLMVGEARLKRPKLLSLFRNLCGWDHQNGGAFYSRRGAK
jgi:hypothetical protein